MLQQINRFLLITLLVTSTSCSQGQDLKPLLEEQEFREKMDEWMQPFRRERVSEYQEWIHLMNKPGDQVWKHPVYQHVDSFYRQHQQQYIQLRKSDLSRYPAAPKLLPGYEEALDFYIPYEIEDVSFQNMLHKVQKMSNFRALSMSDTRFVRRIVYEYTVYYLQEHHHMSAQQIVQQRRYSDKYFADFIEDCLWQITIINRLYVLRFNWNLIDNQVSIPQLWVYNAEKQPSEWLKNSLPQAHTPTQKLNNIINTYLWSLYDEVNPNEFDSHESESFIDEKLSTYYWADHQEYIQARNEELAKYPPLDTAYMNTFNHVNEDLQQYLLNLLEFKEGMYLLPNFMALYEVDGSNTVDYFVYMMRLYLKNDPNQDLMNWIAGMDIHSNKVHENVWEVQFFFRDIAVMYQWNISTDEITNLRVKTNV